MSLINTTVKPFAAQAYKAGKFVSVSDADLKGKWSVVFFYPADFTFVCPTELEDLADNYAQLLAQGLGRHLAGDRQDPVHHGRRPLWRRDQQLRRHA